MPKKRPVHYFVTYELCPKCGQDYGATACGLGEADEFDGTLYRDHVTCKSCLRVLASDRQKGIDDA